MMYLVIIYTLLSFYCLTSYCSEKIINCEQDTLLQKSDLRQKKKILCQKRCLTACVLSWIYFFNLILAGSTLFLSIVPCKDSSARPSTITNNTISDFSFGDNSKTVKTVILPFLYMTYTGSIIAASCVTQNMCKKWSKDNKSLKEI